MHKKISLIIVTYNSKNLIFDCLDSIFEFNDIDDALEVIIVDNDSSDQEDVFKVIRQNYHKNVTLIKNSINGGYGSGNNMGVKHASSNHIIFMNPDVRILNPIFSKLLSIFEIDKNTGMLGVTFADKSNPFYIKPEYFSVIKSVFFKIDTFFQTYDMYKMYMSGSFLMFDKKIFIDAGGFDENIFLYYEEADISNRILKLGKHLVLAKDIELYHLTHNRVFNFYLASIEIDSLEYYLKKYHFSFEKTIKKYLLNYKIKYLVALVLNNSAKKKVFKDWIALLEKRIKSSGSFLIKTV